jgi:hypothetical protein
MAVDPDCSIQCPYTPPKKWLGVSQLHKREAIDGMLMALPWFIGFICLLPGRCCLACTPV